ncbi:MAG: YraN family protein [Egibacteraceae bacterium]
MSRHVVASPLGRIGEQIAALHLQACGLVVLDRNWRYVAGGVRGEIDIVARDGGAVVFCEVKARRGHGAGGPLAAVTGRKQAQLRRLAVGWLSATGTRASELRFDVIGVCWSESGCAEIVHLRGVC